MSVAENPAQGTSFRPERTHIIAAVLIIGIAIMGIAWAPLVLGWLLLFPLAFIYWALRAKTTVTATGITITYAFKSDVTIAWEEFQGIGFQRSRVFVSTRDGKQFNLPGVTFQSLPALETASQGRIRDVLTEGKEAADEKVVITHRDGQRIMMTRDEFEKYDGVAAQHYESHPASRKQQHQQVHEHKPNHSPRKPHSKSRQQQQHQQQQRRRYQGDS
ncbi:PH domain-containing protein [Corynebacterium pseudodiphtheriticum]|uniref:PH domain-containing protein n=1 Tax=Corynebacterium pseudodiphtheriticum TaxID=37637 RepID=UPI003B633602